jgi:hypothetical protein
VPRGTLLEFFVPHHIFLLKKKSKQKTKKEKPKKEKKKKKSRTGWLFVWPRAKP